jgi:hypothetical protein
MRESTVEKYFVDRVGAVGAEVRKLKWIGRMHAQDRFVAFNGVWLVELKRPGELERPGQSRERKRLEAQGVRCRVIDTLEKVDAFVEELCRSH